MAEEIKSTYNCTELELYAIADIVYNNLQTDLAAFAAKKAKYIAAFVTALRATRTAAMVLPDEETRNESHQTLKNKLITQFLPPVLDNFNDLKGYIDDAWPTEDPKPRYESAGGTKYAKSVAHNWESVVGLNTAMLTFITANNPLLTAPGGMPVTFKAKVLADEANFNTNYALFTAARETGVGREAKVKANNLLHSEMMSVMEDGAERVWRNNAAKQKNYTFTALKNIVSPPGSASLRVFGKTPADIVLAIRPVTIKKEGSPAITLSTGVDGIALFPSIDSGKYKGTIDVDGVLVPFEKEVDTGVNARVTVIAP